ncbi:MAG: helix-turn-helix domain-containing protein [Afipia sp.]|nr:helix-turn-helix domain-containing protein [Afipia sp.]
MSDLHPLVAYRKENGLSQDALAEALEVARMTVWRWEAGERKIDTELLPRVAERTGIPARVLRPDLAEMLSEPDEAA